MKIMQYDRAAIKVLVKENLTIERAKQFDNLLYNGKNYTLSTDSINDIDEFLTLGDYIYMKLLVDNTEYNIIHGFPEGRPTGVIIKGDEIVELLPNVDQSIISTWYIQCMIDCDSDNAETCSLDNRDHHYWFRDL